MTRKGRGLTNKGRGRGRGEEEGVGGGALWGRVGTGNLQNRSGLVVIWYGAENGEGGKGGCDGCPRGQWKCAVVDFFLIIR